MRGRQIGQRPTRPPVTGQSPDGLVSAMRTALGFVAGVARSGECRLKGTAPLEGAEGTHQEVGQPPLQAVVGLIPLQHLERGLERAPGPPLRPAKQCDQFRGQCERVGGESQPHGNDFFPVNPLDQQLGR